jgi:transposase
MGTGRQEFSRMDSKRLRQAMIQVKDKRMYIRLEAVWLISTGRLINQVATQVARSRQAIYNWLRLFFTTHDPFILLDGSRSGRPRSAEKITEKRILAGLKKDPLTLGYGVGSWTVATLTHYLNERYGTTITTRTLRRRMKQIGLRYKRPRYVYEEKEPNRAQKKGRSSES